MKSQKGITLISLTIYVIVMAIVVGVVAICNCNGDSCRSCSNN